MTYSELIQKSAVNSKFLVRLCPSSFLTDWQFFANSTFIGPGFGNPIYVTSFDLAKPVFVGAYSTVGSDNPFKYGPGFFPYTPWTSTSGVAGSLDLNYWTYDPVNKLIYASIGDSHFPEFPSDPSRVLNLYAFYELYYASEGIHWHRDPNGNSSRLIPIQEVPPNAQYNYEIDEVYWEPAVITPPAYVSGATSDIFGIIPSQGGQLVIEGVTGDFNAYARESSFADALIEVFHWVGDLEEANISRILNAKAVSYEVGRDRVSFRVLDKINRLEFLYRQTKITDDPNNAYYKKLYQRIYGRVDGVQAFQLTPLNLPLNPAVNDIWFIGDARQISSPNEFITRTVAAGANTTTRTFLNSVAGLEVGDTFHSPDTAGGFTFTSAEITAVNRSLNYIDHTALAAALVAAKTIRRYYIAYLDVIQDGIAYRARAVRDYDVITGQLWNIEWTASVQANLSLPDPITFQTSKVSGRIYGPRLSHFVALTTVGFVANDPITDNVANPVAIILDVILNSMVLENSSPPFGLDLIEREIDLDSFEAAYDSIENVPCGVPIPQTFGADSFLSARSIVTDILPTGFFTLYINGDGKIALAYRSPLGDPEYTLDDSNILDQPGPYSFDYQDIASQVEVVYNRQALSPETFESAAPIASAYNNIAGELYGISAKTKRFETYLIQEEDAEAYAIKISDILSEPLGLFTVKVKSELMEANIGQCVEVNLERMPGFPFSPGTERSRKFRIAEITKSVEGVSLTLDDQKGIEDNSGDW